jgi:hypothetical protein
VQAVVGVTAGLWQSEWEALTCQQAVTLNLTYFVLTVGRLITKGLYYDVCGVELGCEHGAALLMSVILWFTVA